VKATKNNDLTVNVRFAKNSSAVKTASPRIVSEPVPLIGSGLKIKLSDFSELEHDLAHTLIRQRAYEKFSTKVNATYIDPTRPNRLSSLFVASGLSFVAGIAVTTAAVVAFL
jgi:hypothetical protein